MLPFFMRFYGRDQELSADDLTKLITVFISENTNKTTMFTGIGWLGGARYLEGISSVDLTKQLSQLKCDVEYVIDGKRMVTQGDFFKVSSV